MEKQGEIFDRLARQIIHAADADLRRVLGSTHLDCELVAALYLRLREALQRVQNATEEGAIDELALTIYLTTSAWKSDGEIPVDLLTSLHAAIAATLELSRIR